MGVSLTELGNTDRAIENFDKAIVLAPETPSSYVFRSYAYATKGKFKIAMQDVKRAMSKHPDEGLQYNLLGEVCRWAGHPNDAVKFYNKAVQFGGEAHMAYYNLGLTYYKMDKPYHSVWAYLMGFLMDHNALKALRSLSMKDIVSGRF